MQTASTSDTAEKVKPLCMSFLLEPVHRNLISAFLRRANHSATKEGEACPASATPTIGLAEAAGKVTPAYHVETDQPTRRKGMPSKSAAAA